MDIKKFRETISSAMTEMSAAENELAIALSMYGHPATLAQVTLPPELEHERIQHVTIRQMNARANIESAVEFLHELEKSVSVGYHPDGSDKGNYIELTREESLSLMSFMMISESVFDPQLNKTMRALRFKIWKKVEQDILILNECAK
jgi:hypothetical protein